MLKKRWIWLLVAVLSLVFPLASPAKAEDDRMAEREAKISPYLYNYLLNHAGMTSYVFTDKQINLTKAKEIFDDIYEQTNDFIIGKAEDHSLLITKEGLFAAFVPAEQGNAVISSDGVSSLDKLVQKAVKRFAGPTLNTFAHVQFQQLDAEKVLYFDLYPKTIQLPKDVKIFEIKGINYYDNNVEEFNHGIFEPDRTHTIERTGKGILSVDGIEVSNDAYYYEDRIRIAISYSGSNIQVGETTYFKQQFDLKNHFTPVFKDAGPGFWAEKEIQWAVKRGLLKGYDDGSYKPNNPLTEAQFATILARYFHLETDQKYGHWAQPVYDLLQKYNLPLKGYKNDKIKDAPVTRGTLAQVFAATQGAKTDLPSAVQFMYDHGLATARNGEKTFESYNVSEVLKRGQIAAFFMRLYNQGFTTISQQPK
ncbi:S-layer homology domain-containing protein [Parageobacillus thermoglucosidasius]|nr:S-layer homology domain-containing protein [Parageobacillus thermoglucosidasius]